MGKGTVISKILITTYLPQRFSHHQRRNRHLKKKSSIEEESFCTRSSIPTSCHTTSPLVPTRALDMKHFLNDLVTTFSMTSPQAIETYLTTSDEEAFLIFPDLVRGKLSVNNNFSYSSLILSLKGFFTEKLMAEAC